VPLTVAFAGKILNAGSASVGSFTCVAATHVDEQVFPGLVFSVTVSMFALVERSVIVNFKHLCICERLAAALALERKTRNLAVGQGVILEIRLSLEALVAELAGKVSYLNLKARLNIVLTWLLRCVVRLAIVRYATPACLQQLTNGQNFASFLASYKC
jgi:hypothetical protein